MQSMVRNLEKQLEAPAKKPAGGVSLFSMPIAGPQGAVAPGRKPQVGCRTQPFPEGQLRVSGAQGGACRRVQGVSALALAGRCR